MNRVPVVPWSTAAAQTLSVNGASPALFSLVSGPRCLPAGDDRPFRLCAACRRRLLVLGDSTFCPPALRLVPRRVIHDDAVLKTEPGAEGPFAREVTDDAGPTPKPVPAVGLVAAGPTVAQPDPVSLTLEIVDVIVPHENSQHIACLVCSGEEARVDARATHGFVLVAMTVGEVPDFVVFG